MNTQRLATVLWFIAAALALGAAAVKYARTGEIAWEITAAGVFLLAMGIGALARARDKSTAQKPPP